MSILVTLTAIVSVCIFGIVQASTPWHELEQMGYNFAHFIKEFSPNYASKAETTFRQKIFEGNLATILEHNRNPSSSWKMGVNHLTDRTPEEFKVLLGYRHVDQKTRKSLEILQIPHTASSKLNELPASVDWRTRGAVSGVKNQLNCGSCWAFSAAETLESFWFLKTNEMMDLSPQQIASCTLIPENCRVQGAGGCNGSSQIVAFNSLIKANGIESQWRYPYVSGMTGLNYQCELWWRRVDNPDVTLQSVSIIQPNSYEALMDAVANKGPVSISVDASLWHHYAGGIFDSCNRTHPTIDHAVQAVGYGTDSNGKDYWIVRNSWGVHWGEKGYIRVLRESKPTCGYDPTAVDCEGGPTFPTVCGMCGILYDNSYPNI